MQYRRQLPVVALALVVLAAIVLGGYGIHSKPTAQPSKPAVVTAPAHRTAAPPLSPPPVYVPTFLANHTNVVTSEFWVGEPGDGDNSGISNVSSTWDDNWQQHYGGVDSQTARSGYLPAGFTPKENPFYVALPYSDLDSNDHRKPTAIACESNSGNAPVAGSWCKNTWLAISYGGKTVYAQWEDAGPYGENDTAYVFGSAKPQNTTDLKAGLDVSPAVTTYLGLDGDNLTSWTFVPTSDVPAGPWKQIITTTPGRNAD